MPVTTKRRPATGRSKASDPPGNRVVLVLSADPVAAALLGALVESLGFLIRFYQPPEAPGEALRRSRACIVLVDCEDPTLMNDQLLGRARMREVSVVIFGAADALRGVRRLAREHGLETLLVPPSLDMLDEALRRAIRHAC